MTNPSPDPIDWCQLLLGRAAPPPAWWVGEAMARGWSSTELRARAALELVCFPMGERVGPPPYLPQLPGIAKVWAGVLRDHQAFLDMGREAMPCAFTALVMLKGACSAMSDDKNPVSGLVPELLEAGRAAALLIRALEQAGISLSERSYRLPPEESAALQRKADALRGRLGQAAAAPAAKTPAAPKAASRRSGKAGKGDRQGGAAETDRLEIARLSGLI